MYKLNTDISPFVSRYDQAKFMPFTDMYDVLDSTFIRGLKKIRNYGIYPVTVEEGNPALIAERIYGLYKTQFWWIIMYYNDIIDASEIKTGMIIKYPKLGDLEQLYFQLTPDVKTR